MTSSLCPHKSLSKGTTQDTAKGGSHCGFWSGPGPDGAQHRAQHHAHTGVQRLTKQEIKGYPDTKTMLGSHALQGRSLYPRNPGVLRTHLQGFRCGKWGCGTSSPLGTRAAASLR